MQLTISPNLQSPAAYVWKGLARDCGPWAKGGVNDGVVAEKMVSVVLQSSGC